MYVDNRKREIAWLENELKLISFYVSFEILNPVPLEQVAFH